MVQGRLLTAHPGGKHGDGGASGDQSTLRQCRRYVTADAMGMAKERDKTEVNVAGAGGGIGDKHNE